MALAISAEGLHLSPLHEDLLRFTAILYILGYNQFFS